MSLSQQCSVAFFRSDVECRLPSLLPFAPQICQFNAINYYIFCGKKQVVRRQGREVGTVVISYRLTRFEIHFSFISFKAWALRTEVTITLWGVPYNWSLVIYKLFNSHHKSVSISHFSLCNSPRVLSYFPCSAIDNTASNEGSRGFHNHGEGPYLGPLLVEIGYYHFLAFKTLLRH